MSAIELGIYIHYSQYMCKIDHYFGVMDIWKFILLHIFEFFQRKKLNKKLNKIKLNNI